MDTLTNAIFIAIRTAPKHMLTRLRGGTAMDGDAAAEALARRIADAIERHDNPAPCEAPSTSFRN